MALCSITEIQPDHLKTEEKRLHMTPANVKVYNQAIHESGLLLPSGLLHLLDVHRITAGAT